MKRKPKVAFFSLTSDEGCQFTLLDLGERFFNFLKKVELIDFSLIEEVPFPKKVEIDISFVEGNPIAENEVSLLKKIREESKFLVVMGNCAAMGGIPKIKNYQDKEKTIRYIYKEIENIPNPEVKRVEDFVKVDFTVPGCPINGEEFLKFAEELIKGKIPEVCQSPVCSQCPLRATKDCFLAKKKICFGLISLAGCNAVCPRGGLQCFGCRGLIKDVKVKNLIELLKKFEGEKEVEAKLEIFGVKDYVQKNLKL
jgi:coenzyme F420-reducing hydrogenase gamma subunit